MAIEIRTEILINASCEKIWLIIADFGNYRKWNPFITSITGNVKVGNKITVRIEPPGAKGSTFKPMVLSFIPNKELSWLGQLLFTGIFDGTHKLELIDNTNGTATFKQSEIFRGILVPFFKQQLENNTKLGFEEMNNKLKELAEQK
ncbi:hypothetical protein ACVWYG_003828 [Pedobacter sp. UYEF25]